MMDLEKYLLNENDPIFTKEIKSICDDYQHGIFGFRMLPGAQCIGLTGSAQYTGLNGPIESTNPLANNNKELIQYIKEKKDSRLTSILIDYFNRYIKSKEDSIKTNKITNEVKSDDTIKTNNVTNEVKSYDVIKSFEKMLLNAKEYDNDTLNEVLKISTEFVELKKEKGYDVSELTTLIESLYDKQKIAESEPNEELELTKVTKENPKRTYYVDKNNITQGEYIEYHDNGEIESINTHKDGDLHGPFTAFFKNGKKKCECTYINGKKHDKYIKYNENGEISFINTYKDDIIHGPYTVFFENGKKHYEGTKVDGTDHGEFRSYYLTEKIEVVRNYDKH